MHKTIIAVIGTKDATSEQTAVAQDVGRMIAERGWVLVSGGRGGVMEAASRGAATAGGVVVGIIPDDEGRHANPYVHIPIATGIGFARNSIIAHTATAFIAIGGSYGTLSEIAMALNLEKPVFGIKTWEIPGVTSVSSAQAAIDACCNVITPQEI